MAFGLLCSTSVIYADLPGDNRALEPPDSIPNSEVKRCIADGSVGLPHVRVGHRQASKKENPEYESARGFLFQGVTVWDPCVGGCRFRMGQASAVLMGNG